MVSPTRARCCTPFNGHFSDSEEETPKVVITTNHKSRLLVLDLIFDSQSALEQFNWRQKGLDSCSSNQKYTAQALLPALETAGAGLRFVVALKEEVVCPLLTQIFSIFPDLEASVIDSFAKRKIEKLN